MITGLQIRAARAMLGWSAEQTGDHVSVSRRTVERLEQANGVPDSRTSTLLALKSAFEAAGIEFIGTPEDGPGVRLRSKPD